MASGFELVPLAEVRDLLQAGEPLPFSVLDAHGRLLLAAGQRIVGSAQLEALLERGATVQRPEAERVRAERGAATGSGTPVPGQRRFSWFEVWEQKVALLDTLQRALAAGNGDATALEALADDVLRMVDAQPDAALFASVRQDQRRHALYGSAHALDSAVVGIVCARQLGWDEARVRTLVRAALTMNAAIAMLQGQMAEQADPPTKRQLDQIRAHPMASAAQLRAAGVTAEEWLRAVEQHHERDGGSGYPQGLPTVEELPRLLRAADVFTAKISARALRAALPCQAAAHQLLQEEKGSAVAAALIRALGVYPPGDFVRLKSGETAVVVRRTADVRAPQVAVVISAVGKVLTGGPRRETSDPAYAVAGVAPRAGLPRVLPEQVYGLLEP